MNIYLSRSNKNKTSDKYIKGYSKRIFWDFYKKWLWFPSIFPPPPPNKELFLEEHEAQDEAASGWHTSLSGTFFFFFQKCLRLQKATNMSIFTQWGEQSNEDNKVLKELFIVVHVRKQSPTCRNPLSREHLMGMTKYIFTRENLQKST